MPSILIEQKFATALDLYNQGHLNKSIEEWREILRLEPGYLDAKFSLGATLQAKGHLKSALNEYQEVLKADPNHLNARLGFATILSKQSQFDVAIPILKNIIDKESGLIYAQVKLGTVFLLKARKSKRTEDWKSAQQTYQRVLSLQPNNSDALHGLGFVLWNLNKQEEGIRYVKAAIKANPTGHEAICALIWMRWRIFWQNIRAGHMNQAFDILKSIINRVYE